jgi:flagellar export protein FliJ
VKRYEFRAAKVLRVRRLQEDIARADVAAARHAQAQALASVGAMRQHYAELAHPAAPLGTASFLATQERGGQRAEAVVLAQHRHDRAQDATAVALDSWRAARQRVEGLERLDERRRAEYDVAARRDEDLEADEIVIARARSVS